MSEAVQMALITGAVTLLSVLLSRLWSRAEHRRGHREQQAAHHHQRGQLTDVQARLKRLEESLEPPGANGQQA